MGTSAATEYLVPVRLEKMALYRRIVDGIVNGPFFPGVTHTARSERFAYFFSVNTGKWPLYIRLKPA